MQQGLQTDATCNMLLMSLNKGETALHDYYWLNDMTVANIRGERARLWAGVYIPPYQQCWELLANNVASVCTTLGSFPVILLSSLLTVGTVKPAEEATGYPGMSGLTRHPGHHSHPTPPRHPCHPFYLGLSGLPSHPSHSLRSCPLPLSL